MREQAIALKEEHRQNWGTWSNKERQRFITTCRRLADKLNPSTAEGDDCVAVIALDIIQTRSGHQIWKKR
jgi:hypothetical protein